jgi:hypothetical protein
MRREQGSPPDEASVGEVGSEVLAGVTAVLIIVLFVLPFAVGAQTCSRRRRPFGGARSSSVTHDAQPAQRRNRWVRQYGSPV